jgi:hypothetical protein
MNTARLQEPYSRNPLDYLCLTHRYKLALYWELQPLQLGKEFWLVVAAALVGVELSVLNHLLLDGLLIPLPKGIKKRLAGT